jgi:hypothetical protein
MDVIDPRCTMQYNPSLGMLKETNRDQGTTASRGKVGV